MLEALKPDDYLPLVKAALAEDIGTGDATTLARGILTRASLI